MGDDAGRAPTAPIDRPEYSESMFAVMLSQYAVMQVVVAATALVRNKIIALRLGPAAFGEVAQLGTVVSAITSIVTFGMQVSLSRNVARAGTIAERQAYLATANGLVLSLSLLATGAVLLLLVAGDLLTVVGLPVTRELVIAAGLFFSAIPLIGLQTNLLSLLQGLLDVRGLAVQRSLAVLLATAVSVPLVWILGLVGAAATFLAMNALLTLMFGLRCRALGYDWHAVRLNRAVLAALATFGLASMVGGFGQTLADTAIRASLLRQFGSDANGLFQAPLVLATTLQAVVLGSIGSMSLATLSRASSTDETRMTIDRLLGVALPLSTAALGLLGLLGVPAIVILYSDAFASSATLLPWILCAYLVQVSAWVVGAPLLAAGDRAIWLGLELTWSAVKWLVSLALLPHYGAAAVGMGMLAAICLHLVLNVVVLRVRYDVQIDRKHVMRLVFGMAVLGVVAVSGANWTASVPALIGAAVLWVVYAAWVVRSTPAMARLQSIVARR